MASILYCEPLVTCGTPNKYVYLDQNQQGVTIADSGQFYTGGGGEPQARSQGGVWLV